MNAPAPTLPPAAAPTSRLLLAGALVVAAGLAAWHNSFHGPFVLDDLQNIAGNTSLRDLGAWRRVLAPPADIGVGGRPVLNLTLALNYRYGRDAVGSYHAVNLAIHLAAGLTLLALVRRTLGSTLLRTRFGRHALPLATGAALLWTLQPVQTASVTYVSQRAESLMGLFYLLTLYCFVRGVTIDESEAGFPHPATRLLRASHNLRWHVLAVAACALGMATKEVMVTAPLAVLLYDRTFVAGTFRDAWRARRWLYTGLAATWLLLAVLLADAGARGIGTARGVAWTTYALTECRAVVHYLSLALWPHPLVFDHGTDFLRTVAAAAPYALVLVPLLAITLVALVRWPAGGFAGAWFFGILAPTSSVVPVAFNPLAENRLYLPLAVVAVALVLTLHALAGRRAWLSVLALALACGALTARRNHDYRSELALWADTVAKRPDNPHARYNLGVVLARAGRLAAAAAQWRATLRDEPLHPPAHENLANALVSLGRVAEALPHYEAALRQQPLFPLARANYGLVLLYVGRERDAEEQLKLALRQDPKNPGAHTNYGLVLERLGRPDEAIAHYETALRLDPGFADAHHNLGVVRSRMGASDQAITEFETVVRLRPDGLDGRLNLARVYLQANRLADAEAQVEAALARFPKSADAHLLLGNVYALLGQLPSAIVAYERALELRPSFREARENLATLRARLPR